jgi:hypothetical protein
LKFFKWHAEGSEVKSNLDKYTEILERVTVPQRYSGATETSQEKLQQKNKFIAICVLNNTRHM